MNILVHIANLRNAMNSTSVFYLTNQIAQVMEYRVDKYLEALEHRNVHGYIVVTSWLHHGYIMVTSWLHHGYIIVTSWLHHGYIMGTSPSHHGIIVVTLWLHHGCITVTSWLHYGYLSILVFCMFFLVHTLLCEGQQNSYGYGLQCCKPTGQDVTIVCSVYIRDASSQ